MHNNFTFYARRIAMMVIFAFFGLIISSGNVFAQTWGDVYGNEWLAGKYNQPWQRIGVKAKGIQRVILKEPFKSADKTKLALYHRGNQVSIISVSDTEILFYGVVNDGSTDRYLYRPESTRKNPHYSIYSDESAYFLTINASNGDRAQTVAASNSNATTLTTHNKSSLTKFLNEYSHQTVSTYRPSTFNSYFEDGKQGTGTTLIGDILGENIQTSNPKNITYTNTYVPVPFSFQVINANTSAPRKITVHLKGRLGNSTAEIFVGKTAGSLRSVGTVSISNFNDYDFTFDLQDVDYDGSGLGTLGFKTTRTGVEGSGYSVSYYTVDYQQTLSMQNLNSYEFEFPAAPAGTRSDFSITNAPADVVVYDITNADVPKIVSNNPGSVSVDRNGAGLKLLASKEAITVDDDKISTVTFNNIVPSSYDYLIISSEALNSSATDFATYRRETSPGKKYKTLVTNIKDIYNQFNYGEPSTVAIRRYVDFMISDNNKNKFLLLVGKSVTFYSRIEREMPNEVPTMGFPGSDVLLVDGLGGVPYDVPAIPVGRIGAIDNAQVLAYLEKVKEYERQTNVSWRKNIIHVNGGKSPGEVTLFSDFLANHANYISASPYSGNVIPKVKTDESDAIQQFTFAPELNGTAEDVSGVGMVTYFGHGDVDKTDYNAGYATDNSKGYTNGNRNYPVMFYNGCGVNNIFSNRNAVFGSSPSNTVRPISLDWLVAPNGAIVVFGNTWDAYADNSDKYLDKLYPLIFSQTDKQRGTIGEILKTIAAQTKTEKNYTYDALGGYNADRANIHQILLQGDPAMRILLSAGPLPVKLISFDAVSEEDKVSLKWSTASEKNNGRFELERSYNAKNFEKIGTVEGKGTVDTETKYSFIDSKPLSGTSYYRLKQVDRNTTQKGDYIDGDITYSRIISVTRDAANFFVISPNPTADFVDVKLNAAVEISNWEIVDVRGRVRGAGKSAQKVDLSSFESGSYILKIVTKNGDVYTKKVVRK